MKVYNNDMLVKSHASRSHVEDLEETFATLHRYQMKLNLAKYMFGVTSGKFLGFMASSRGIDTNPENIQAMRQMATSRTIKDVQRLTGRIATLGHFVFKSAK